MRGKVFALIAFIGLGLLTSTSAHAALETNLLGYWRFEGTGADSSGHGNTVTLNGGAGYGPGLFGQGLTLNGVSGSNASMTTNNPAFNFGSSDFTIQMWAQFNTVSNAPVLLEKFFWSERSWLDARDCGWH